MTERQTLQQMVKIEQLYEKKINLNNSFTPHTKINSKWIQDLNIRPKSLKPLKTNKQTKNRQLSMLFGIDFSNNFWICPLRKQKHKQINGTTLN